MNYFFLAAALTAAVTFCVHTFAGGPVVARPLLADETLPQPSKWLSYYCWHIATVVIAFTAAGFAYASFYQGAGELVIFLSALTLSLSLLSAAIAIKAKIHPLRFPSTYLFAATSALGWAGLAAG